MKPRRLHLVSGPSADTSAFARVAGGDVSALGEVYDRHAHALVRFAASAGDAADAEDVLQATFIKAAKLANRYDGRADDARAWLFGIAARVIQERRRSVVRYARALLRQGSSGRIFAPQTDRTDVERALATLTQPKRMVVVLAEVEGFTCDEIAAMLGIPIGTVWTRLHHARRELRHFFEEETP